MPKRLFRRRYYHRLPDLLRDVWAIRRASGQVRAAKRRGLIDSALQERLMLAVTEVNGCRYCAYFHAKMALMAGLTQADIDTISEGSVHGAPAEQVPALLYAQHWAETDGRPDPDARRRVVETYGREKTEAMELCMCMIRVGNLAGNTGDYLLYRASFGRWGVSGTES